MEDISILGGYPMLQDMVSIPHMVSYLFKRCTDPWHDVLKGQHIHLDRYTDTYHQIWCHRT